MRPVLVVAMADSVHTLRWVRMVRGRHRIVLVSSTRHARDRQMEAFWPVRSARDLERMPDGAVGLWLAEEGPDEARPDDLPPPLLVADREPIVRGATIARAIRELDPVLLHSLEVQHAGYACLAAVRRLGERRPPWLLSNWGSDILLYRKLAAHQPVLREVAARVDAVVNECERDSVLLRDLGFTGRLFPPQPASGGADFEALPPLAELVPPSQRRTILVKTYHGWSGRGMHILSALHLAAPRLRGLKVRLLFAQEAVRLMAQDLATVNEMDIAEEPWLPDHRASLERIASARMMVASGISDGIGTTLLEAMSLGAFPIVTCGSCANEWLENGRDGMIVSPHDVRGLADAISRAAEDDALVDGAVARNRSVVEQRWNMAINGEKALQLYATVIADARGRALG